MDAIESRVSQNLWLGGQQPSKEDATEFANHPHPPNPDSHPHAFAWWCLVSRFVESVRSSWAAAAPAKEAGAGAGKKEAGKKGGKPEAAAAKPAAAAAEEEFDPFAEDPAADAAAAEAMKAKGEAANAAKKKAAPIAKSIIVWEVKPWGEETDLDALAAKILAITMDGLTWKTEYKKEPVAYGVFKIVIGAVVEDEKVSTDLVEEAITAFEDEVQSIDI